MCKYVSLSDGVCKVNNQKCPFVYFCNKIQCYKPLRSMPEECKMTQQKEAPKGFHKVRFERRHKLYIEIEGNIVVLENPYEYIPSYVKTTKTRAGEWKIKEGVI